MSHQRNRLRVHMRRLRWQVRTWLGRDLKPRPAIDCELDRCETARGGWAVCPVGLTADSLVYSLGIGEDISWDRYLIERYGVTIHAFDPTPRSLAWLRAQPLPPRFHVHPWGVADFDGETPFRPPLKPHHVDYTIIARTATRQSAIQVPMLRLSTIMRRLGHEQIDLLKMDIEGAEYGVIADLLQSGIAVPQLLIEFHHRFPEIHIDCTRRSIRLLGEAGYQIFAISDSGQEYGFLQRNTD